MWNWGQEIKEGTWIVSTKAILHKGSSLWELFPWEMGIVTCNTQFKTFLYVLILFPPNTIGESDTSAQPSVAKNETKEGSNERKYSQLLIYPSACNHGRPSFQNM